LGGSFNPPHLGHLALADEVLSTLDYDRLLLIPSYQSPLKKESEGAGPEDRLDMLAASLAGDGRIGIDDCEIRRGGLSYTIDTIADLERRYRPEGRIGLVIGDDLVDGFVDWKRADEVADRAELILARRLASGAVPFDYPHRRLANDVVALSSSALRQRIASGGAWRYQVSGGCRRIIEDRGLYGYVRPDGAAGIKTLIALVEATARQKLDTERLLHSRQVALLAADLAGRFGLVRDDAYLAGIAHDMCKRYAGEELIRLASRDGAPVSSLEAGKPALLHARAAAVLLAERFGVADDAILEAVRWHTTGRPGLGKLAKLVYIADKIEASRRNVAVELRDMAWSADLELLFAAVVRDTVGYLRGKGRTLSAETEALLKEIGEGRIQ
jgi:nicotinate-nucleotide adenylyltransferase